MNLITLAVLLIIAGYAIFGAYRGFIVSTLKGVSFFFSWVIAYVLHPLLSKILSGGFLQMLTGYMEGVNKLAQASYITLPVEGLSSTQITEIVGSSKLMMPFDKLVLDALNNQSYAAKGLTTVGEYFNSVCGAAALNIVSFFILFLIARIVLSVIINAADFRQHFPVLKHHDSLIGGIVGLLQGFLVCFVLFTLTPLVLSILNQQAIIQYFDASVLGSFFYNSNFILMLIRGRV